MALRARRPGHDDPANADILAAQRGDGGLDDVVRVEDRLEGRAGQELVRHEKGGDQNAVGENPGIIDEGRRPEEDGERALGG
jgi:hypothetical protein